MTDENKGGGEEQGAEEKKAPTADQFGVTLNEGGEEVTQEEVIKKEDKSEKEKTDEEKEAEKIANNPTVKALEDKIKEYGENLTGQRTAHEKEVADLKKQLADALAGKGGGEGDDKGGENVMFKDIKFSKDLTEEERDDMTATEIALFDQNAQQQVAMNKLFETVQSTTKSVEEVKVTDLNSSAQVEATRLATEAIAVNKDLAKDATELKDKIIVEFNEFNNEGITPEKLVERMQKALNNVHGYTPPKEQEKKGGNGNNAIKENKAGGGDTSAIDAIVAGITKSNEGTYNL
jgi:hypothetical protein